MMRVLPGQKPIEAWSWSMRDPAQAPCLLTI